MMDKETYLSVNIPQTFNLGVDEMFPLEHTINVSVDAIQSFLNKSVAQSTIYKDSSAETRFKIFLQELNPSDERKVQDIPPHELDDMCKFFMTAKKIDKSSIKKLGELSQPDSLSSFLHCWQRILNSLSFVGFCYLKLYEMKSLKNKN